ncbi:hypothetical protein N9P75_01115 [Schleiferiaceae bacterium]|nr:hypothetical protein [Schleiferiaceae bacterium]
MQLSINNIVKWFSVTSGFVAYADFGVISHMVLPLLLSIVALRFKSLNWLVLAALSITDISISVSHTPDVLRKVIIIALLLVVIYKPKFRFNWLVIFILTTLFIITLYNTFFGIVDKTTFTRDVFVLLLFLIPGLRLDIERLIFFGMGAAFGIIFGHFAYDIPFTEYHSFTSTKAIMSLPVFYYLSRSNKSPTELVLAVGSLFAIILLQTRMVLVTIAIVLLFRLLVSITFRKIIISVIVIYLISSVLSLMPGSKTVQVLYDLNALVSTLDIEYLKILDPVRWAEHRLFFTRNIFEILFGSGFGSGLSDYEDILGFVKLDQTAFSRQELLNNVFFNLHDTWIDLGLRYGLLAIGLVYYALFKRLSRDDWYLAGTGIVILSNMSFSNLGLLIIFIFLRAFVFNGEGNDIKESRRLDIG